MEAFAFEGTRARSRNKDGKNVPDATTAFKTAACLNVTLAHAKIGCDFFERHTDSKAALFHQAESFGPFSKEFFTAARPTRWVIYGAPSDEFKKANADFHPIYMTTFDGFVR